MLGPCDTSDNLVIDKGHTNIVFWFVHTCITRKCYIIVSINLPAFCELVNVLKIAVSDRKYAFFDAYASQGEA